MCLYKTTTKHQNYVPSYSNRPSQNNARKKPKTKENCNSEILHISLPQIILLQKDTQALKIMFPATQNDKAKNARKSQKQNKLATARFTTYHSFKNYTFTKRHQSIKNYVPSC